MSISYRVTLVPLPGDVPPLVRLRKALKALLRAYRLRCENVEELAGGVAEADCPGPARMPVLAFARISGGRSATEPGHGQAVGIARCEGCAAAFEKRRPWARFCSTKCRLAWRTRQRRGAA